MAQSDVEFFLSGLSFTEVNCIEFPTDGPPNLSGGDVRGKKSNKRRLSSLVADPGPLLLVGNCNSTNAV